jgi:Family of unknown function (DUF6069)
MMNRTHRRIATVVLAPITALTAWAIVRLIGVDLVVSTGSGKVSAGDVVVAATLASALAWIVVRQLERHVRRPLLWWSRIGSTGLAVSIIGPTWLADGSSAVALIGLHIVTAVVMIIGFAGFAGMPPARPHQATSHRRADAKHA